MNKNKEEEKYIREEYYRCIEELTKDLKGSNQGDYFVSLEKQEFPTWNFKKACLIILNAVRETYKNYPNYHVNYAAPNKIIVTYIGESSDKEMDEDAEIEQLLEVENRNTVEFQKKIGRN